MIADHQVTLTAPDLARSGHIRDLILSSPIRDDRGWRSDFQLVLAEILGAPFSATTTRDATDLPRVSVNRKAIDLTNAGIGCAEEASATDEAP